MLYSILDADARLWWYHKQLRKDGQAKEARRLERLSIRRWTQKLRSIREEGGGVKIGRGGATMHGKNWRLEGIGMDAETLLRLARAARVPFVDTRAISDDAIVRWALQGPMPDAETRRFAEPSEGSPYPYSSLCSVEFREWARLAEKEDACIYIPEGAP